jgi:hypothetical protein
MAQYEDLVEKVQGFADLVMQRRSESFACRAGCDGCCRVELSIGRTEARRVLAHLESLGDDARAAIKRRVEVEDGRCVMLDAEGRCGIYAARPMVCRTQGLPLGYPPDVVPVSTVRSRARGLDVICCPLNFTQTSPADEDVLDAGRVDTMLALVARLEGDEDPDDRVSLRTLADRA